MRDRMFLSVLFTVLFLVTVPTMAQQADPDLSVEIAAQANNQMLHWSFSAQNKSGKSVDRELHLLATIPMIKGGFELPIGGGHYKSFFKPGESISMVQEVNVPFISPRVSAQYKEIVCVYVYQSQPSVVGTRESVKKCVPR